MADRKGSVASRATNADPPTTAVATSSAATMSSIRSTSPYGTRSRFRGPRVNYAEDKDNEMDFEFTTPYNPTPQNKTNGESSSSGTSRRQPAAAAASAKDSNPAKDAALAVPAPSSTTASGKKRKSAAQKDIPPMVKDASLSNMYSFEKPFLQDRKLIADDGTVFAVHGM
jgi:hypothetical protein